MEDKAHRLTDEKLEEMGKRLSAIYSRKEVYQCTSTQSKTTMNLQPAMSLHFWKPTQQSYRNV